MTNEVRPSSHKRQDDLVKISIQIDKGLEQNIENLPKYQTLGSSGMDIQSLIDEPITIDKGKFALIPTGIRVAIPEGYEIQVRSRSGMALKHGVFVLNSPGTIDSDYRGEIKIILANFSDKDFIVENGMRIAQLVVNRVAKCSWDLVSSVGSDTVRQESGFGSTGIK